MQFLEFVVNLIVVGLIYAIAIEAGGPSTIISLLTIILLVFYTNTFYVTPILVKKKQVKKYWLINIGVLVFYFSAMILVFVGMALNKGILEVLLDILM